MVTIEASKFKKLAILISVIITWETTSSNHNLQFSFTQHIINQ